MCATQNHKAFVAILARITITLLFERVKGRRSWILVKKIDVFALLISSFAACLLLSGERDFLRSEIAVSLDGSGDLSSCSGLHQTSNLKDKV